MECEIWSAEDNHHDGIEHSTVTGYSRATGEHPLGAKLLLLLAGHLQMAAIHRELIVISVSEQLTTEYNIILCCQ